MFRVRALDRAGKLTPEVTAAIDGLKEPLPGDKAPYTVAEYLRAAPIVHEFMSHVPYGTDASTIAEAGIPSVVFGPGDIAQAHTKDEWIELDQLEPAAEILFRFACPS